MHNYRKYLIANEFDKRWDFYINSVGSTSIPANNDYPNNRVHPADHAFTWDQGRILNGYYIVYVSRGEGVLETSNVKGYRIKAGTCFFLFPGIWHRYRPDLRSGWEEYWVGFNGAYPAGLMTSNLISPEKPVVEVGMNEELLALFHSLIKTVVCLQPGYQQIAAGITLQILGLLAVVVRFRSPLLDRESRIISNAKFIMQETINKPLKLEELVKELSIGYSKFRKLFKKACGMPPNQYHLNLRLEKAKELLCTTNLTINEIAYQTGFESIFYFSRQFKKKNDIAPKSYRTGHQN